MFNAVAKPIKDLAHRFGLGQAARKSRLVRARHDLCSMQDYEETFRDLFLSVEDGDPLYTHKRTSERQARV